jgi:hypothetical protein
MKRFTSNGTFGIAYERCARLAQLTYRASLGSDVKLVYGLRMKARMWQVDQLARI